MRRIARIDRVLLLTLVPLWLIAEILHLDRQLSPLPLAWFPAYLASAPHPDSAPEVLGPWDGAPQAADGLLPGDRLLEVGGHSLRGATRLETIARTFPTQDEAGRVPFVVEREGVVRPASLLLLRVPSPGSHLPLSLSLGISATLVLLRARGGRAPRAYALAALAFSLHFCSLYGGLPWQTRLGLWLVIVTGALYPPLMVRAALLFPESAAPRSSWILAAPWALAITGVALYAWIFGIPSLSWFGFRAASLCFGFAIFVTTLVVIHHYRIADAQGRNQMKWGIFGLTAGSLPVLGTSVLAALSPALRGVYEASLVFQVLFPVCMFIALVRNNLFDIHRLITTTAACTLIAPVALGGLLWATPLLATWLSARTGLQPGTVLWTLALLVAAPIPLLVRWLRPRIERLLFREQFRAEHALQELRAAVGEFEGPAELLGTLAERLAGALGLDGCVVYSRAEPGFLPVSAVGASAPPLFAGAGAAAALLSESGGVVDEARWRGWARRGLLTELERASLEGIGASAILPIYHGDRLEAFACLGDKLSGDLLTRTETALLESLGERLGLFLEAVEQRALDREERRLFEELARYAPAEVVQEVLQGGAVEPGEREVTILFVDIRGYTSMSRERRPPEIYALVNAYTTAVSSVIREYGGTVVEFHGDGLMAAFGTPRTLEGKERRAVEAARAVCKAIEGGEIDRAAEARVSVGVGIATGAAFVGNIQAVDRQIFGVIGNTTNLAARLQGLTRDLDASIAIDAVTHERASEAVADFEKVDDVRVKGRDDVSHLWRLPLRTH